jgi:hypothetical protein
MDEQPDTIVPGPWIPELFRSMTHCDEQGRTWRIDQSTWRWVLVDRAESTVTGNPSA